MKVDPRFLTSEGLEVFTGSEMLVKGALEADGGVHLLGGYPGSPIAGYFDSMSRIKDLLKAKGIHAVINNNEALSAAMLNGTQALPCRAMIVMKSVGVHVAADALALGNLAGAHKDGGAIVVYGDDPWSDSTQVPSDSRYISKHLFIPVIEPANPQDVKDYVDLSFKLSRRSELYAGYVLTTNLADGGGSVQCRPNQYPDSNVINKFDFATKAINLDKRVMLPPRTWWQEESFSDRHARAIAAARELGMNQLLYTCDTRKSIGFATSGLAHSYLLQALEELGLLGEFPILKFGMSYPIDSELVGQLANQCERIIVVEERRAFLEDHISEVVLKNRQLDKESGSTEVWGKKFPMNLTGLPETRGLHPSILIEHLVPLFKAVNGEKTQVQMPEQSKALDREIDTIDSTAKTNIGKLPPRIPSFCPGCPHRDSANLCLEIRKRFMDADYMKHKYKSKPVDLLFHGDTGCYTMLLFPPNEELMHDYSGMGLGGGTGSGTDPFIANKEVVFMGDSTFFHSGQLAISQAVKFGQDITFIILDNSTTGMTGHQPTPGVDYDVLGNLTAVQDIEEIVRGIAGENEILITRADPEKRPQYRDLLESTFLSGGVKVIIATKECGITRNRRKRRQERQIRKRLGFLPTWQHMNINQEVCRFCLTCAEFTGCPGLKHADTHYGRKMDTDITWCVDDGACERIGACNSFERVTIKRKRPPKSRVPELGLDDIPEPQKRPMAGDQWQCCLVGVGGMGVGVATSIIVRAGHKEGYNVIFLDKKGLAIRNGGTISQVVYNKATRPISAIIPYGKADLLIGIDVLEAARALDSAGRARIASPEKTTAVINTAKNTTITSLWGEGDFDPIELEKLVRSYTRQDDFLARDISRICEKYLGSKLYANIMMLGFAFQNGQIPVSMHSMAWAIKDTIRTDFRKNLYAFNMGRKLVVQRDLFQGPPVKTAWQDLLEERCRWTIRRYRRSQLLADRLRQLTASTIESVNKIDEALKSDIVVRLYDCMRWGGMKCAQRYAKQVCEVNKVDDGENNYASTHAVVHNLANAMLIKDPFFIAELSTSPQKYARDREKYNVNPANGDKIAYHHLWHWNFRLGSWEKNLSFITYDWMLKALRSMRGLRKFLPGWSKQQRRYLQQYEAHIAELVTTKGKHDDLLAILSSPRCMNCTNAKCADDGCPLSSDIPAWTQLAYQNRWQEASQKLHEFNNFPEFTSEICPALCQSACKQSVNDWPVQAQSIEREIIERAFGAGWVKPSPSKEKTGKRVAIVGSGPAGLAASQQLVRTGHDVTVFEKDNRIGGLLRFGIPDFRLDKNLIDRRLEQLHVEGVVFKTGVEVGKDISADKLRNDFDAVLLATGAGTSRDLDVQGREQAGIHQAIDFLRSQNCKVAGLAHGAETVSAKDKIVAVIGGGMTGEDCVETAIAQGAWEVHQFEILPRELADSAGNGSVLQPPENLHRRWCVSTKSFGGNGDGLSEITASRVEWTNSPQGQNMREIPNSDFRMKIDMAILAMGFEPKIDSKLASQLDLDIKESGQFDVNDYCLGTCGVFAAGDLVNGASYVATAIDSGRKAADKINQHLTV